MREIKFRAWDKENNCWFDSNWNLSLQPDGTIFGRFDNDDWIQLDESRYNLVQYTGLKDKNGVEIYESDLVQAYYPTADKRITGEVTFDTEQFIGYKIGDTRMSACTDFEVIGNIHENPELLK